MRNRRPRRLPPRWFARTVDLGPILILPGMIHIALVGADVLPVIFLGTSFGALMLGASMGAIEKWRTERGIWLLASFLALAIVTLLGAFAWGIARDAIRGTTSSPLMVIDIALTLSLWTATAGLLAYAARWNWRFTRRGPAPPSRPDAASPVPAPIRPDQPTLSARARTPIRQ